MGTMRQWIVTAVLVPTIAILEGPTAAAAQADSAAPATTAPTFTWEGALTAGQTLEVKGVSGPVRAVAASGNMARVTAVRSGRRSDPNEVQIVALEHAGGVTLCAVYPSGGDSANQCGAGEEGRISAQNNDVQVEFTVEVPTSVAFNARTVNGSVTAESLTGPVDVRSTNGSVSVDGGGPVYARTTNGSVTVRSATEAEASTTNGAITAVLGSLDGTGPLSFTTTNGSITLTIPATANANINARTTNGRIVSYLPVLVHGDVGRNRLAGTLGSGGREVELRTTNGSIRLTAGG